MALASILTPPANEQEFFLWTQAHALHHYDCCRVAGLKFARKFSVFVLDPFDPKDMDSWLEQHEQMHLEMDATLGIAQYALDSLEWDDPGSVQSWFAQNYAEHQQWAISLKLG